MKIQFADAGAVRAVTDGGRRMLEVLAIPYGSPDRRDRLGQYFTARTDLWLTEGDRRPVLYMHGFSPQLRQMAEPPVLGTAEVARRDERGVWMRAEIDDSPLSTRTWEAAKAGQAKASTGSIAHLERHDEVTGEVLMWPVVELSVFDGGEKRVPVSDDAIVLPIRAIYNARGLDLPEAFEADEAEEAEERETPIDDEEEIPMSEIAEAVRAELDAREAAKKAEEQKVAAIRAQVIKEMEETQPKQRRAIFNIGGKVAGKQSKYAFRAAPEFLERYTKEELEEASEHLYYLMRPLQAPAAMRVLEETEAAEGAGLIPTPTLDMIVGLRDEASLVAKMGMVRLQTNSLTLRIPREDSGMAVFATIAEEGAYVANEPAFSAETVTVVKKGSMITVTEEMLEDSSLFLPYFTALCARKWALTENLILFTELKADDTAGTHSATFTQAEIDAFMFQITEPWADGAHLIMAQATMATIRGLLVATPRAYGDFPTFGGLVPLTFFGYPTHLNSNWEAVGAGDTTLTMTLVNPAAMSWVERRGLEIKVDPYGDALNGRVRYFPSFRAACATTQVLGNVSYTDHA